jgi:L-asparaginase II
MTLLAEITRGNLTESEHHGVISVVHVNGQAIASVGDTSHSIFFRSSAKPFQAVPLVESGAADRFGFSDADLALCCSSHDGAPWQQAEISAMLEKLELTAADLKCGTAPPYHEREAARVKLELVQPTPIQCDCSGKHTGMLATCLHRGYPIDSYLEASHPLQQEILEVMGRVLRVHPGSICLAPDGCSIPTFGAPIHAFATAYATLAAPDAAQAEWGGSHADALNRIRASMAAHPQHLAGPGEVDSDIVEVTHGRIIAKLGAEGLICLALPDEQIGIAVSVSDGSQRATGPIVIGLLDQLGVLDSDELRQLKERHSFEITNFNGWRVGEIRPAFALERL